MAQIFYSDQLPEQLSPDNNLWVYNGLDATLTHEIYSNLEGFLDPSTKAIYTFERALQNCTLEMTLNGLLVHRGTRFNLIQIYEAEILKAQRLLDTLAQAFWEKPLSPTSPKQCQEFFYDFLLIPPVLKRAKGKATPTTDDKALQEISKVYFWAKPFVSLICYIRDKAKLLSSLKAQLSPDGKMRSRFSVAGTETGRFSAAKDNYGDGLNLQNQNERAKRMYIAEPGRKLAYIDLEQAESRMLAAFVYSLFGESLYLDACESDDLHTVVCKMIWPNLAWTDNLLQDKKNVAEQPFYRHFSYRDMAKRAGHGTNYWGQPAGMAHNLGIDSGLMETFQESYFKAFPGIRRYHAWIIQALQTTRTLVNPFGRKRIFFDNPSAKSTIREAIAFMPQSSIGDLMNLGMWKVQNAFGGKKEYVAGSVQPLVKLHAQVHDAILISYPERLEDDLLPQILELIPHPLLAKDREVIIPCSAETGWNWGKVDPKKKNWTDTNPDGLKEYEQNCSDTRKRIEDPSKASSILGASILRLE